MKTSKILIFFFVIFGTISGSSQNFDIKLYGGASYYLGDLAPYTNNLSFSKGRAVGGVSISFPIAKEVTLTGRFMHGSIEGTDELARSYNRLRRNLSFRSPLTELSVTTEVYMSEILPFVKKWGVDFYLYTGISVFKFNPKTLYEGEWVDLQPLGTEGQGVVEFGGIPKYNLIQVGIPLGAGIEFNLTNTITLGFEVAPRLTFTDYLDDVSTDYVDYDRQVETQGLLTANLGNRIAEFERANDPTITAEFPYPTHYPGYVRGDPSDNDWYLFTNFIIGYSFDQIEAEEEPTTQF